MGDVILTIIKLVFFVLLLPLVVSIALTLPDFLNVYPAHFEHSFLAGLFAFLLIYLFVYQFWAVYENGQKITQGFFHFAAPIDKILSYVFPFYMFVIFVFFYATSNWLGVHKLDQSYMFLMGFSLCMHLILTSQDFQQQEQGLLKPTYFFWMVVVFILNILIFIGLMDLILEKFTFLKFLKSILSEAKEYYLTAIKSLF